MKVRSSSYLMRLIIFSLIIGTFPVVTLGYYSYYKSTDTVQQKVNEGNKYLLQQTQMGLEQHLKTVDHSITQFTNTNTATKALDFYMDTDFFEEFTVLADELMRLQSYDIIEDIYFVNLKNDWVRNNDGLYPLGKILDPDQIQTLLRLPEASSWVQENEIFKQMEPTNGLHVLLVKKLPFYQTEPSGLLIAKLSTEKLSKLLSPSDNLGRLLVVDDNYRVLLSENHSQLGLDLSAQLHLTPGMDSSSSPYDYTTTKDGDRVRVTQRKSTYNHWNYISIVAIDTITKASRDIGWITFIICILILLGTVVTALLGSRKIYFPIFRLQQSVRKLYQTGSYDLDHQGKESSAIDELKFIDEGIDRLLSSQAQLANRLQGQMKQLNEFFILKMYQGEVPPREMNEKIELYDFPASYRWLCVLTLQIDNLEETHYEVKDQELLLFAINNIVSESIPSDQRLLPILIEKSQVTLVFGNQEHAKLFLSDIFHISEKVQQLVEQYLNLKISIGISRPFSDFSGMSRAYQEGLEALNYRIRLGQKAILYIDDVQPDHRELATYPVELEKRLLDVIKFGEMDEVHSLLRQLLINISNQTISYREFQLYLVRLLIAVTKALQQLGQPVQPLFEQEASIFDQLFALKTQMDIEQWFVKTLIQPFVHRMQEGRELQYKRIAETLLGIIHEQYDTDLSLEQCAARMNYHDGFLKRVLRKEMNVTFSEYLAQYRLSVAKRLLSDTDIRISDIAEKLRYNNPQNFIRYFRRLEGITPGQFRVMNRK